jgi:hypothetical protein
MGTKVPDRGTKTTTIVRPGGKTTTIIHGGNR